MRKRLTAVALAGTVGLGAVGATVLAYPALADSAKSAFGAATSTPQATPSPSSTPDAQAAKDRRIAALKEALKGLVDDKTLTQAQADKVASTLAGADGWAGAGGPGRGGWGHGGGLFGVEGKAVDDAAAKALGLTTDELNTQLRSGSTLAQIAKKQGKDVNTLVKALVASAKDGLAQAVKDGRITQDMATQIEKTLEARIRSVVQNGRPAPDAGGPGWRVHGGPGWGGPGGPSGGTSTPSPSATGSSTLFRSA